MTVNGLIAATSLRTRRSTMALRHGVTSDPAPLHDVLAEWDDYVLKRSRSTTLTGGQRPPLRAVATHIGAGDVIAGVLHGDKAAMITRLRGGGPARGDGQ